MNVDQSPLLSSTPSLMRLALVERQLVMQHLDFTSLARVMCTCHQLAAEALHPQSGKFIQTQSNFPAQIAEAVQFSQPFLHPMRDSPLFRAHMPMELRLSSDHAADIPGLIEQLTPFKRFHEVVLWTVGVEWTEERALQLLRSPVAQSLRLVWGMRPGSVWLESLAVQRAILRLPLLHKICCDFDRELKVPLDVEALADARMLREATIEVPVNDHRALVPLAAVPQLRHLMVLFAGSTSSDDPPSLSVCVPSLTSLSVNVRAWGGQSHPSREHLRALLAGLPNLAILHVENLGDSEHALQACLAVGAVQLPALRRLEILSREGVSEEPLRRLLTEFPSVEKVHFRFNSFARETAALEMVRTWAGCRRVLIVPPCDADGQPYEIYRPHEDDAEESGAEERTN